MVNGVKSPSSTGDFAITLAARSQITLGVTGGVVMRDNQNGISNPQFGFDRTPGTSRPMSMNATAFGRRKG